MYPPRCGSAADRDPARPVLLGPLQAQPQHPVLEPRLDPVRVDPERELDGAAEGAAAALAAVVGLRLPPRGAAGAGDGGGVRGGGAPGPPASPPGSSATPAIPSRPAWTFTAGKPAAGGPPAGPKAPARRSISSWRRRRSRKGSPPKKLTGRIVATARSSPDRD